MMRQPLHIGVLVGLLLWAPARVALAQGPTDSAPPPQGNQIAVTKGLTTAARPFWESSESGPFVSSVLELGVLYYRTQVAVGEGKPHWNWAGLEGSASISPNGGSSYAGLRAVTPVFDLRAGARYAYPLNQYFLPPRDSYQRDHIEYQLGPQSRYVALEGEVAGSLPALGGNLFGLVSMHHVLGVPDGFNLYEESLHVVMSPPWLLRARAGYLFTFGANENLKFGAAAEVIGNQRAGVATDTAVITTIVRAGPVVGVALTHHLEAVGSVMVVAASPDALGLLGAELGQLGLRYRWATSDRWPEFP